MQDENTSSTAESTMIENAISATRKLKDFLSITSLGISVFPTYDDTDDEITLVLTTSTSTCYVMTELFDDVATARDDIMKILMETRDMVNDSLCVAPSTRTSSNSAEESTVTNWLAATKRSYWISLKEQVRV